MRSQWFDQATSAKRSKVLSVPWAVSLQWWRCYLCNMKRITDFVEEKEGKVLWKMYNYDKNSVASMKYTSLNANWNTQLSVISRNKCCWRPRSIPFTLSPILRILCFSALFCLFSGGLPPVLWSFSSLCIYIFLLYRALYPGPTHLIIACSIRRGRAWENISREWR